MSSRSTTGCWTCRLRKKKCDEQSPACQLCSSLALTCHGYGSRPEWMDGQVREREMTADIRRIVKATASQKRRTAMLRRHHQDSQLLSMAESTGITHPPSSPQVASAPVIHLALENANGINSTNGTNGSEGWHFDTSDSIADYGAPTSNSNISQSVSSVPSISTDDDQANLLMHFLDHVFPLLFPFYESSIWNGGRGWLLSTLLQTKPLYHAALSLAAYHRQSLVCQEIPDVKRQCFEAEAYVLAIGELRKYLEGVGTITGTRNESLVDNVKVLCCLALLISLEVFIDSRDSWRMHLHAASKLVGGLKSDEMMQARKVLSPSYEAALFFFSGVIAWYDILSCATTASKPFSQCRSPGASEGFLHFDKIMGCENWAMLCIMDIAILDEWKNDLQASGKLSMRKLVDRAMGIERRLEDGLSNSSERIGIAHTVPTGQNSHDPVYMITQTFACAALVYLHVVVSGPCPELPEIRESVTRTTSALRAFPDRKMAATLSWPLCIAGCMALEEKDLFRNYGTSERTGAPTFGNSSKVLAIMEECWKMRKQEQGTRVANWRSAMSSLGADVLLV